MYLVHFVLSGNVALEVCHEKVGVRTGEGVIQQGVSRGIVGTEVPMSNLLQDYGKIRVALDVGQRVVVWPQRSDLLD